MLPYFEGLEQGEALRQFQKQFPNGIEDEVSAEALKDYYNDIASKIINNADHGQSAIEHFRKEITSNKEITQGKHFNLQHLIAAHQAYFDNFNALGHWKNRDLFWQKVIGYVQRQMTAYDVQIHCSGVKSVLDNQSSFSRTFELSNGKKLFPLLDATGLGFDFGCYSCYAVSGAARVDFAWRMLGVCSSLKSYVEQKRAHWLDLESHLSKECIISPINCS